MSDKVIFHSVKDKTVNNLINKISDRAAKSNAKHNNTIDNVNKRIKHFLGICGEPHGLAYVLMFGGSISGLLTYLKLKTKSAEEKIY